MHVVFTRRQKEIQIHDRLDAIVSNRPQVFSEIIAGLTSYCKCKHISRLNELVGKAADLAQTYSEIPLSPGKPYPEIPKFHLST